jgi:hypothetical protein
MLKQQLELVDRRQNIVELLVVLGLCGLMIRPSREQRGSRDFPALGYSAVETTAGCDTFFRSPAVGTAPVEAMATFRGFFEQPQRAVSCSVRDARGCLFQQFRGEWGYIISSALEWRLISGPAAISPSRSGVANSRSAARFNQCGMSPNICRNRPNLLAARATQRQPPPSDVISQAHAAAAWCASRPATSVQDPLLHSYGTKAASACNSLREFSRQNAFD